MLNDLDPGPTDAADLFVAASDTLSHGGRAYRRQLLTALLTRQHPRPTAVEALREANQLIFVLTGRLPAP